MKRGVSLIPTGLPVGISEHETQKYCEGKMKSVTWVKIRYWLELFLCASVIGWLYESVWYSMVENQIGFVNRGTLCGPWLVIYGVGILVIISILKHFKIKNGYLIFLYSTIIAATIELLGSYVQEFLTGTFSWDYTTYFINFEGRIALKPDITFGLMALFGMKQVVPLLDVLNEKYDNKTHNLIFILIFGLFVIDVIYSMGTGRPAQ